MADLNDTIQTVGGGPAEAEADGQRMKAQPLTDLVVADRYLKQSAALRRPMRGLRLTKLVGPPQCPAQGGQFDTQAGDGSFS